MQNLETDYLVIGCGAAGMAFTDSLIAQSDADVIVIDRREAPGGHWNDAYPFVQLHQPSSYYGVNSMPLGSGTIQQDGPNKGYYEQASAPELRAYFHQAMAERLLPSGKVRYFPSAQYVGDRRFVCRRSGAPFEVKVRRKVVDATYLEPSIPATTAAPFEVADGARCIPVGDLPEAIGDADRFVIIGAGKTAMDACLWLLRSGVPSTDIRWVKPREPWLTNRAFVQGGEQVGTLMEGRARQMEAAARAESVEDLFARLVASAQLMASAEGVRPTMYTTAIASEAEVAEVSRIEDVVRLGRVRRLERDALHLEQGKVRARSGDLHVHCAAKGLNRAAAVPIFATDRITLQPIRAGLIPFNAAAVGFIEATRGDVDLKNRLCPPNPLPDEPLDWLRGLLAGANADYLWSKEPDIAAWLESARLNPMQGLRAKSADPQVRGAMKRYVENVRPALANAASLL